MLWHSLYRFILLAFFSFIGLAMVQGKDASDSDTVSATQSFESKQKSRAFLKAQKNWADSVLSTMTLAEKVGQLFMVSAYSNKTEVHYAEIEKLITQYHIGGLCFFQGGPARQLQLTNRYQNLAKIKMLISMDAEWGLGMRLDSTVSFPRQMTYGAITGNQEVFRLGAQMAYQCSRMGVHISFSPVVDVNSNPSNPVIGNRSFGSSVADVISKSLAYMDGLQSNGVMACAKHFPGHGDASSDSHFTLPVIARTKAELDEVEIKPFKSLISNGVMGIMSAHLYLPALDTTRNKPSSVSPKVVTGLLRNELGFSGLAFTDALNMKGAANYLKPGELELLALVAGNDVLLCPENVPTAVAYILAAITEGRYSEKALNEHVNRVLLAKYWVGLNKYKQGDVASVYKDLNMPETVGVIEDVYAKAATLVKNENNQIPITRLNGQKFASVSINAALNNEFQATLENYTAFSNLNTGKEISTRQSDSLLSKLKDATFVVVGVHGVTSKASINYNISASVLAFIDTLQKQNRTAVVVFGNAYSLKNFVKSPILLSMYEDNAQSNRIAAQILFGGLAANGHLPVSVTNLFVSGTGIPTASLSRLSYRHPSNAAMNTYVLDEIDVLAQKAIADKIAPSMAIIVAKDGQVVYNKAFGNMSFDNTNVSKINTKTRYDLASLSKTTATLLVIEHLNTNNLVILSNNLAKYLPHLVNTDKGSITIRQLLEHRAGLQAFIPLYKRTLTFDGQLSESWYSPQRNFLYNTPVAHNLFGITSLPDSVNSWIIASPRLAKLNDGTYPYKYSDLSFYFLQQVAEAVLHEPIDIFLRREFYDKIGANTLVYNPLSHLPDSLIAPTENDTTFRHEWIRGTVHDPLAAMQGGVGGNAGLFGTANDVAKIMQMQLNGGSYGGISYLPKEICESYTKVSGTGMYRGLGWDKPPIPNVNGATSVYCSPETFGHTGFTGTCTWADPKYSLVFVFLSNRICPDANNKKLIEQSIRPKMMDIVYRSFLTNYPNLPATIASDESKAPQ